MRTPPARPCGFLINANQSNLSLIPSYIYMAKRLVNLASRLFFLPVLVVSAALLTGCDSESPELVPSDPVVPQPSSEVKRAVFVYLLSDNSLGKGGYDRDNLSDMIEAAKAGRLGGNRLLV